MYNDYQRKKIYKWFYHILHSNFTIELDQLPWNISELRMLNQNSRKYMEMAKLNASDFNITDDYFNDFLDKLLQMGSKVLTHHNTHLKNFNSNVLISNTSAAADCNNYCTGAVRDAVDEYKNLHGYISLVICIFGTIANILNIVVLTRKDMSKTPINRILMWLAVTDMFVMIEYIPFSCYMYLIFPGKQDFKYSWAVYILFHMHFTQILHTISISLTVTLALWRYIAIKHPHGKISSLAQTHYGAAIFFSFILSPILCFPTYFVFRINQTKVWENNTEVALYHLDAKEDTNLYRFNFWVHSIIIKLIPCCVLTIISFILIQVLCKAGKRKQKLKTNNNVAKANGNRLKPDRRTDRTTLLLLAVLLLFLVTEFPQGILGLLSGILAKCFFTRCYSLFGELMDLLALINAAIGFLLYGLMSKQFRTSFKSVFVKPRVVRMEMTRTTNIHTTCV